jgi:hypothetical protein
MKVKIKYNPESFCCYEVHVKKGFFRFWQPINSFEGLEYAKIFAKSLFKRRILPLIYKSETEIL